MIRTKNNGVSFLTPSIVTKNLLPTKWMNFKIFIWQILQQGGSEYLFPHLYLYPQTF